ncbi:MULTISPECIES: DeoR/GlpR family DNA-binding transcription regulator [unclassified Meiothermus]|uniref:DeoR/GlpR family DNA-binding transcription regulator n=1 Tax=unclassified Meiothermus TaxID=370471 RepID=UPI000D7C7C6F|nr:MULTISPECIES: DeoR/GlpR family DNA-binding transcription regulator [unclassified Meiothermus]PZA06866.1 DeoR/GlpR transcriptional regulator [Meiothermus sp. Pnk-1]RYM33658.1 DeoR/GlpR transcriptional regulator [Meiothermus sp. PNK-Is4]
MKTEDRRSKIIELLERKGSVQVDELVGLFGVSHVTIRKDLTELEGRGLLHRTHGGATAAHKSLFNPSFREKIHLQQAEKQAIAQAALEYIEEGDTLVLDAGTTTLVLAQLMKRRFRSLYVITNSVPIALELSETRWDLLLLGGQVRHHSMALIGPAAVRTLEVYHADKAFMSATGVTAVKGYTTPNPYEAQTKQAMIRSVDTAYALVDSSKLGRATLASFAALEEIDLLITDEGAPKDFLQHLERQGLKYQAAELERTASRAG